MPSQEANTRQDAGVRQRPLQRSRPFYSDAGRLGAIEAQLKTDKTTSDLNATILKHPPAPSGWPLKQSINSQPTQSQLLSPFSFPLTL